MDCYFCGVYNKLAKEGICSFLVSKLDILFRATVDDKDEVLIDFSSLLLLFEFITMNPLLFKNVSFLDFKGSNAKVLEYINNEKNIPKKVKPFVDALTSFCMGANEAGIKIYFTKVPKSKNLSLSSVDVLKVNKKVMQLLNNIRLETDNDRSKGWK